MEWTLEPEKELIIEDKIGHLRCDFYDGSLSNSWFDTHKELNNTERTKVGAGLVRIINQVPDYDFIVDLCGGEGLDKSTNRFCSDENFIYWINFIPVMDSYHYYVHVYTK